MPLGEMLTAVVPVKMLTTEVNSWNPTVEMFTAVVKNLSIYCWDVYSGSKKCMPTVKILTAVVQKWMPTGEMFTPIVKNWCLLLRWSQQ